MRSGFGGGVAIHFADTAPSGEHVLALPVLNGEIAGAIAGCDAQLLATLARSLMSSTAGRLVESLVMPCDDQAARILLFTVENSMSESAWEKAGAALADEMLRICGTTLAIDLREVAGMECRGAALGAVLRGWRNEAHLTDAAIKGHQSFRNVYILTDRNRYQQSWEAIEAVISGVSLARALTSEPANVLQPSTFAARCREFEKLGLKIRELDAAALRQEGMEAMLAVARGSSAEPRLLVVEWAGHDNDQRSETIALVGKGVTFDAGGLSLKAPAAMELMKWDMAGAATVVGTLVTAALRQTQAHIIGVCGLVENMPDGNALRPGDVIASMNGQTIEVVNTDAEGRLVLCDALTWTQKHFEPDVIIDIATLTNAVKLAFGHGYAAMFSHDDALAGQLLQAGHITDETLWRMPLDDRYAAHLRSDVADLRNRGPREGGALSAAYFLSRFVEKGVSWAHLDIASVAWASAPDRMWQAGATGFGVRLLDQLISSRVQTSESRLNA